VTSRVLRVAYESMGLICGLLAFGRLLIEIFLLASGHDHPGAGTVTKLGCGLLTLGLGAAILISRHRDRSTRLFALALLAGAGSDLGPVITGDFMLPAVSLGAFACALLSYPPDGGPRGPGRDEIVVTAGAIAALGAAIAVALPPTLSQVALFGAVLPALALVFLRHRGRDDLTAIERARIRLLFGILASAAVIMAVLLLVFVPFPTVRDAAPLVWFSHLVPVTVAISASRRVALPTVQRLLGPVLVVALVTALIGGLFVVLHTVVSAPVAAVPAAVLLQPVRARVERRLNRLLYGRRPTPYSVLAGIGAMTRTSPLDATDLARVAEAVGRDLGAHVCRLSVVRPGLPERTYAWTRPGAGEDDVLVTLPIIGNGERLGSITVDRSATTGPDTYHSRLVADVADSLGTVLEAYRLRVELERQLRAARAHADAIARSRQRLVAEMDAERRRIERDLHDGAQHYLVSLRLAIGLAEHRVSTDTEAAEAHLDRLTAQIDEAESVLVRTAAGVTSPRLARLGLVAALEAELGLGVTTAGMPAGRRFPAAIETAVWFCCLEAVNNARRYAPGAPIRIRLSCREDRLEFGVHDDGPGWEPGANADVPGRGLRNVTARVRALGGVVGVRSQPAAGTRVDGWVPLPVSR
jgi:signal transduction histidine kinase